MKRLALAASIALAISTIGAGPAAANSLDATTALATQEDAQEPGDAENAADTTDSATDHAESDTESDADQGQDGKESTESGEPTVPGNDTADPDGSEDEANEDAADGATEDAEESEPIDARFSLENTEMTAEDIGDPDIGIRYTIDPVKAGDIVTAAPGEDSSTTVESDGAFTGTILGNTELKTGDTLDVTVTVEREGQDSKTFSGSVEVIAPDDEDDDADLTVSPKTQNLDDFMTDGVQFTLVNCVRDEEVNFRVTRKGDSDTVIWEDTQKAAGEDAAGYTTFIPGTGGDAWVGEYLVMASCGDRSAETTFTVTDNDSVVDPKLSIDPQKISGEDFVDRDKGVTTTVTECAPGREVQFEVWGHEPSEKLYNRAAEVDENGSAPIQVYGLANSPEAYVGTYKVTAVCMDQGINGEFVVTSSGGGSGGSSDDSGNAGSMPRTGAELTGLGAGAVLILTGAATIDLARRRAQA